MHCRRQCDVFCGKRTAASITKRSASNTLVCRKAFFHKRFAKAKGLSTDSGKVQLSEAHAVPRCQLAGQLQGGGFEPPKALSHQISKHFYNALESGAFDRFATPACAVSPARDEVYALSKDSAVILIHSRSVSTKILGYDN